MFLANLQPVFVGPEVVASVDVGVQCVYQQLAMEGFDVIDAHTCSCCGDQTWIFSNNEFEGLINALEHVRPDIIDFLNDCCFIEVNESRCVTTIIVPVDAVASFTELMTVFLYLIS